MSVWRMETSDDSENVAACAATLSRFLVTAVAQVVLRDFGAREAMRRLPASTFFEDIVSNKITTSLWNWRVVMTMNRCWFMVYKWFTRSWEYIPRLREREYVTLNVTRYKEPVPVSFSDFVSWGTPGRFSTTDQYCTLVLFLKMALRFCRKVQTNHSKF